LTSTGEVVGLARTELDVTDRDEVHAAVAAHRPTVVINCAAWTDVDGCEVDSDRARRANAEAPGFLREACEATGAHLVHISTDYVFDGEASIPYREDDPTGPLGVYASTKLDGETAAGPTATVVRTSWLQASDAPSMVDRFIDDLEGPGEVPASSGRRANPTFVDDLVPLLGLLAAERHTGVVHATNAGTTTWASFARLVAGAAGHDPGRIRETVEDGSRLARRPSFSALDNAVLRELGHRPLRHHAEAATEAVGRALAARSD
tara:strand:- start:157 stop:945 length:789 start_codon:yes stop_codon:yes gene_type:complete